MNKDNFYKTINYYLSAFFIAKGHQLEKVEPEASGSNKVIFVFYNSNKLQELITEFYGPKPIINPRDFVNAQKYLKSLIYQNQNEQNKN